MKTVSGQSNMQYKGLKDIDSLAFFINDKMGNGKLARKVSVNYNQTGIQKGRKLMCTNTWSFFENLPNDFRIHPNW